MIGLDARLSIYGLGRIAIGCNPVPTTFSVVDFGATKWQGVMQAGNYAAEQEII